MQYLIVHLLQKYFLYHCVLSFRLIDAVIDNKSGIKVVQSTKFTQNKRLNIDITAIKQSL